MLTRQLKTRNRYWTRERMIEGGARFYRDHQVAPTNEGWWQELTQFTARTANGSSNHGKHRPYPSMGPIKNFWKSMRDFWKEVATAHPELNILLDKGDLPWSPLEEWFITETVGLIPRTEVARLMTESGMGRTEPAIKRRLYELGVNSYNRWGWTVNHLARVIGVSGAIIQRYIDHGSLPFFQTHKYLYIEPADFLIIREYDWTKREHPAELEEAVRKSLMQRLCYVLLRFDYQRLSHHRIQPRREFFTGRIKKPRHASPPCIEPRPTHIAVDDWVVIIGEWSKQSGAQGRVGQVKNLVWSPQRRAATQKSPARSACWMATVEFQKQKMHGNKFPRVRYNVPASALEQLPPPPNFPRNSPSLNDSGRSEERA